jgi:hypothetical protein
MRIDIEDTLKNAKEIDIPSSTFAKVDDVLRNLAHRKGEKHMKPRYKKSTVVAAAIAAMLLITTTAFAAWHILTPSEVADRFENPALSAAFDSGAAVNINQSVTSGDYIFTLLAVATGKDITDMPYHSDTVSDERTYAVVAIQKADGTPMPAVSDSDYGSVTFLATPLIKGLAPWQFNAVTMNGGYSATVVDGVEYRIVECDGVTMFADRGLYFAITTDMFINNRTFLFNEDTGEVAINPAHDGASAIFDLPLDRSLADPIKAEQYIAGLFGDD